MSGAIRGGGLCAKTFSAVCKFWARNWVSAHLPFWGNERLPGTLQYIHTCTNDILVGWVGLGVHCMY